MDNTLAFIGDTDDSTVEVVVNFGPLTGREATIAEVDRLARRLLEHVDDVTVVASRRHELTRDHETDRAPGAGHGARGRARGRRAARSLRSLGA